MSVKVIRGRVEIHAEGSDIFRVEHRDGAVEFASSPEEAMKLVKAHLDRSRRRAQRIDSGAEIAWITTIEWHVPPGTSIPGAMVKA